MKFTVWGKMGKTPVRITYDNGKLTGEPIEVVKTVQYVVDAVKSGRRRGIKIHPCYYYGPDVIDTPHGYKGAIAYVLTSIDRWEGELPPRGLGLRLR